MSLQRAILASLTAFLLSTDASPAQPNTTVITHGFTIGSKGVWVQEMAEAIIARAGGGTIYRYQFPAAGPDWTLVSTDETTDVVVLIFNWTEESDGGGQGPNWGYTQAAGDALYAALRDPIYDGMPGPEDLVGCRALHFIGHSRGASVNSEAARRLAKAGIPVDQITTLDPHPVNGNFPSDFLFNFDWGDPVPEKWDNVAWADNYWRSDNDTFDFDGMPLVNVFDNQLDEPTLSCCAYGTEHLDVHLWYHGTIDLAPNPCDGEQCISDEMRATWWPEGFDVSGFYFAQLGGGSIERPDQPDGVPPGMVPAVCNGFLDEGSFAGWRHHGGAGGNISSSGEYIQLGSGTNQSFIRHNRFWLDGSAEELEFLYQVVVPSADDTLEVFMTDVFSGVQYGLASLPLSEAVPLTLHNAVIPAGVPRRLSYTLTFEIDFGAAVESTVRLDDVVIMESGSPDPPPSCACLGDVNEDGLVDILDLLAVLSAWGPCPDCPEDVDENDSVDVVDLLELLAAWGPC